MKHKIALFVLMLSVTIAFGQDVPNSSPADEFNRWQIGLSFSPDICFRTLKNTEGSSFNDGLVDIRNDRERTRIGYTAGLNAVYNFNRYIGIGVGVHYSNKGYQTCKLELSFPGYIGSQYGITFTQISPDNPATHAKFVSSFHYFEFPINASFTIGGRKFRFISSIGVAANIFFKTTTTSILYFENGDTDRNTSSDTYHDFEDFNISPFISAGLDYKISKRMSVRIEPTFRYGVLKIIDTPVTAYLWSGGVNVSYYVGI